MSRRRTVGLALVAACLVLTGCGISMPDSGPVHQTNTTGSGEDDQPGNIDPAKPRTGASRQEIVSGFLSAMQETPAITTSVARLYLTKEAAAGWQPVGMLVYGGPIDVRGSQARGNQAIEMKFNDAYRTDARGGWLGPASEAESTVRFPMAFDDNGEWRISAPPPYLLVPQSWFEQQFRQVSLYFFDPSATMLIPEPVFVPRGRQFASTLVNALLQGPSPGLAGTEQNYLPQDLRSVVSVPVSTAGVAKVDLTSDSDQTPMPTTEQSELLISQLAWTLQQDPTIARFRVTIDNRPVQLGGETEFTVAHGHGYAPYVAGSSTQLFGLRNGLMVGGSPQNLEPVTGAFGKPGYDVRSVTPDLRAVKVAAVSSDGAVLWDSSVKDDGKPPTLLLDDGQDLLRPAWDFNQRLWEVDRRTTGAVVYYKRNNQMHELDVPGITGYDVKSFLVSRDGSRLVAVIRGSDGSDSILVSRILNTTDGQVARALTADDITDPGDLQGQIRDIAWQSPTSLAVLRPLSRDRSQIRSASVDGANGLDSFSLTVDGRVSSLAGSPVPDAPLYAFAPETGHAAATLVDLGGQLPSPVTIAPDLSQLAYVG